MSPENTPFDPELEQAVQEIRDEQVDPAVVEAAAARVWARLAGEAQPHAVEHIRTCADFQALIPELRAGRLSEARAFLLKDHVNACVACRRVYEGKVVAFPGGTQARRPSLWSRNVQVRRAVAAAITLGVGLSTWAAIERYGWLEHDGPATVQVVNGTLYRVAPGGLQPFKAGDEVQDGVEVRTAKDSGAMVQLRDGSLVEMRERSALATSRSGKDLTVRLGQGSIVVQAAHRRTGHLFVATNDCRVAVTGTVFGVSAGVKGSRVSVVEGEVHVTEQNGEKVLHSGDQATTSTAISPVRVQDDLAWSRNHDQYLALLKQFSALNKSLDQVKLPDLRYSSRILNRLPAGTALFVSIPNLGRYLAEAQDVLRQRIGESPELRAWFEQSNRGAEFQKTVAGLATVSEYFGDEIVIAAVPDAQGKLDAPVFLAEERKPGFNEYLAKQGANLRAESREGMLVFGLQPGVAAAALNAPAGFASSPIFSRVAEAYRNGAGIVFAADLSRLMPETKGPAAQFGVRYVMAEQKQTTLRSDVRAVVGFTGPRTGVAAWLAAPAPMGALQYVSPDATFVTAFLVKNPSSIVDELVGMTQGNAEVGRQDMAKLESDLGLDIRNDLARSLGGEFALALDGPLLPVPSWKLVLEVYDPNRLQWSLQKLVETYNRDAVKLGNQPMRVAQEVVNGRTYFMIGGADGSPLTEAHYTFGDGYMLVAPSRALIDKALQVRANGVGITRSSKFLSLLPRDHYADFSGMIYQNLGTTLAPLAGLLGGMTKMSPEGQQMLNQASDVKATLVTAYGENDRIEIAGTGDNFKLPVAQLLTGNLSGLMGGAMPFGGFGKRAEQGRHHPRMEK